MSGRVAILTPDPEDEGYRTRWREVLARNAAPLETAGLAVEGRSWTNGRDLADFDLVLPLLVWGYPRAHGRWLETVRRWAANRVAVQNPASVLAWNADKRYLGALARRGAPVVPTRYVDCLTGEAMVEAVRAFGTERLVAKPQISSTAWRTIRWSPGSDTEGGPSGAAMLQPYLPAIETHGEVSMIFFGGRFSHAVRKRPRAGDFRVQPEFGSIIVPCEAASDEHATAERVLAAVEEPLLYARLDLVRGLDGAPRLMELELIEPDLYTEHAEDGGRAFGRAAADLIAG